MRPEDCDLAAAAAAEAEENETLNLMDVLSEWVTGSVDQLEAEKVKSITIYRRDVKKFEINVEHEAMVDCLSIKVSGI